MDIVNKLMVVLEDDNEIFLLINFKIFHLEEIYESFI